LQLAQCRLLDHKVDPNELEDHAHGAEADDEDELTPLERR
jgi:hypothetical protein